MRTVAILALVLSSTSCHRSSASALDVCRKLETAGIAKNCKESKPGGLGAAASDQAVFDLVNTPDKTGQVLRFETASAYDQVVKQYEEMALIAGPHRYGSPSARIFVQMNEEASLEDGKKAKAVVSAL